MGFGMSLFMTLIITYINTERMADLDLEAFEELMQKEQQMKLQ